MLIIINEYRNNDNTVTEINRSFGMTATADNALTARKRIIDEFENRMRKQCFVDKFDFRFVPQN